MMKSLIFKDVPRPQFYLDVSWVLLGLLIVIDLFESYIWVRVLRPPWEFQAIAAGVVSFLIAWGALKLKRLPLQTIGLTFSNFLRELAIGIVAYGVLTVGKLFVFPLFWGQGPRWPITVDVLDPMRILILLVLALVVGIGEEALFRGFFITALASRLRSLDLVVLLSGVIFGVAHFWRLMSLVDVFAMTMYGIMYAALYLWRGYNLTVPITVHVLWNFSGWLGIRT